jgi:hypothetical protein
MSVPLLLCVYGTQEESGRRCCIIAGTDAVSSSVDQWLDCSSELGERCGEPGGGRYVEADLVMAAA